jgi:hypothetical protein
MVNAAVSNPKLARLAEQLAHESGGTDSPLAQQGLQAADAVPSAPRHNPADSGPSWRNTLARLTHPAVRDLAFLLLSPPLLNPNSPRWHMGDEPGVQQWTSDELTAWRRWLFLLDAMPERLERALAETPASRLGRYAEQLLGFALSNPPSDIAIELLASHMPVLARNGHGTAGEIDFVVSHDGRVEHWELGVKFYLATGNQSLEDFVGPTRHDTLGHKLIHLFDQQMQRPLPDEFTGGARVTRRLAYLRGWLFYPAFAVGLSPAAVPAKWGLNPDHPAGVWLEDEDATLMRHGSWLLLPRLSWLSPAKVQRGIDGRYPTYHLSDSAPLPRAPELWVNLTKREDGARHELQRAFLVPLGWAQRPLEKTAVSSASKLGAV